jgi:hypothetical protein
MDLRNVMFQDGNIAYDIQGKFFERFTADKWCDTHKKHRQYIDHVARNNQDKKIFVITHHLPLEHVGDPYYKGDTANAYYASDLSDVILDNANITHWCFGHSHFQREEFFEQCLMINNAVGYKNEGNEIYKNVIHKVYEL